MAYGRRERKVGLARRVTGAALALAVIAASPALAADLDPGGAASTTPVATGQPAYEAWSGFHIGLLLGHGWHKASAAGGGLSSVADVDGVEGGLYAGYDRQVGRYVFGVEGDVALSEAGGSAAPGVTLEQAWAGSIRARAGIALDQYLVYGTGGLAAAGVEVTGGGLSDSATLWGWTIGAGAERMLGDNVTARFEYRYSDYDGETFTLGGGATGVETDGHSVRAGMGIRF